MAHSETKEQDSSAGNGSGKRKKGRISETLVVIFMAVGTLLALAEMGTNVINELENRQANTVEVTQPTPTAAPTLSPEEYEQLMENAK